MVTLVLTNRNRDIRIIKNCLDSLQNQTDTDFEWFLVDYGSQASYLQELEELVQQYSKIQFISCPTEGQLWSKCRAINIAIQNASQPYFVVGDIDLIFHPNYIAKLKTLAKENEVHYFQYGFLSETESLKKQAFEDFVVDFKGYEEVTGNTLFPTAALRQVNGFDEFYQGWGAEDTDAHIRMKQLGLKVLFYDQEILVKHQWHPKAYRTKNSTHPYHSQLERINHQYMKWTEANQRTVVNLGMEWGKRTDAEAYAKLQQPTHYLPVKNTEMEVGALLAQLQNYTSEVLQVEVSAIAATSRWKNQIKIWLGKKHLPLVPMEQLNNLLLEELIKKYRNVPYHYAFDRVQNKIVVTLNFAG